MIKQDHQSSWYQTLIAWGTRAAQKRIIERLELDFKIGTMLDRLSTVNYVFVKKSLTDL